MEPGLSVHEICSCRAEFTLSCQRIPGMISLPNLLSAARDWRRNHVCPRRSLPVRPVSSTEPWQNKYVGQACNRCGILLDRPATLTTLAGKPVHQACKRCYLCGKVSGGQLYWTEDLPPDDYYHPPTQQIMHRSCWNRERVRPKPESRRDSGTGVLLDLVATPIPETGFPSNLVDIAGVSVTLHDGDNRGEVLPREIPGSTGGSSTEPDRRFDEAPMESGTPDTSGA